MFAACGKYPAVRICPAAPKSDSPIRVDHFFVFVLPFELPTSRAKGAIFNRHRRLAAKRRTFGSLNLPGFAVADFISFAAAFPVLHKKPLLTHFIDLPLNRVTAPLGHAVVFCFVRLFFRICSQRAAAPASTAAENNSSMLKSRTCNSGAKTAKIIVQPGAYRGSERISAQHPDRVHRCAGMFVPALVRRDAV